MSHRPENPGDETSVRLPAEPTEIDPIAKEAADGQVTRREFVIAVGTMTGAAAVGFPFLAQIAPMSAHSGDIGAENLVPVKLQINGVTHELSLDPRITLLDLLRENLGMTGTKLGCNHGQCGSCTVLVNGRRINSCLSLAVVHDGDQITTIEGLPDGDELHPLQAAFMEHDGFQCGYCTPGQICSAVGMMNEAKHGAASYVTGDIASLNSPQLSAAEIRERMSGNICRCGAYPGIVQAIQSIYEKS
jgi:xanthine dehydrogenase YagT iron-sulfur-binding subunit